jgi:hypothetical protein
VSTRKEQVSGAVSPSGCGQGHSGRRVAEPPAEAADNVRQQAIVAERHHATMAMHLVDIVATTTGATLFIIATSAFKEPQRRHCNAIMIAGAGAAYLNGGLGIWEFAFTAVVTSCACKGLNASSFISLGWLLHTGWDIMHHLYETPIVPFVPTSSLGCAMCDPIIAAWCCAGAPAVYGLVTRNKRTTSGSGRGAA